MRLLLVEDDRMLGAALKVGLQQDGHAVDWVRSADEADTAWIAGGNTAAYDAVVLDLGLPDGSGLELLRARTPTQAPHAGPDSHSAGSHCRPALPALMQAPTTTWSSRSIWTNWLRGCGQSNGATVGRSDFSRDRHRRRSRSIRPLRSVTSANQPVDLTARELAVMLALAKRPGVTVLA